MKTMVQKTKNKSRALLWFAWVMALAAICPAGTINAQGNSKAITPVNRLFTVTTADELRWIGEQVNNHGYGFEGDTVILANDIDLNGQQWIPIGNDQRPFRGVFDGKGHVIKNIYMTNLPPVVYLRGGLFGQINGRSGAPAIVRNLGIIDSSFDISTTDTRQLHYGIVAGYAGFAEIDNCYVENSVIHIAPYKERCYVGGIVGYASCTVRNCFLVDSSVRVILYGGNDTANNSASCIGGIAGIAYANITGCYIDNTFVMGNNSYVGGIVGQTGHKVENCFNAGRIIMEGKLYTTSLTGNYYGSRIGGIVGNATGSSNDIKNCYTTGDITWKGEAPDLYNGGNRRSVYVQIGGISGYSGTKLKNCYATGKIEILNKTNKNDRFEVGGLVGGGVPGSDSYTVRIFNSIFSGTHIGDINSQIIRGAILGYYPSRLTGSDKDIANNYFTDEGYPAIGATAMLTASAATNYPVEASRLMEKEFYLDAANWKYDHSGTEQPSWARLHYDFQDGKMPMLRRLVKEYTASVWDGISMQMAPSTPDFSAVPINNPAQLAWIAGEVNNQVSFAGKTIELQTDIDLGNHNWPVIGNIAESAGSVVAFRGNFDGKNHTIKNFQVSDPLVARLENLSYQLYLGLFGQIKGESVLSNIRIDNCLIAPSDTYTDPAGKQAHWISAGALAGYSYDNWVDFVNCHATNVIVTTDNPSNSATYNIGGLVGVINQGGTIDGCSAQVEASAYSGDMTKENALGGLVGLVNAATAGRFTFKDSSALPTFVGNMRDTGGLIGRVLLSSNNFRPVIENCFVGQGQIINESDRGRTGGLIGYLASSNGIDLLRSYSLASVEGFPVVGGFIGYATGSYIDINQCFARGNVHIGPYAGTGNTNYNGAGFIGNSSVVIRDCYATGNVSSADQGMNYGHLGGFIGYSGSREAIFNCYSTGWIDASEAATATKNLGSFSGGALVNVWNCFTDAWVNEEGSGTIHFNGFYGAPEGNPTYTKELFGYVPYEGKKFGFYTDRENFRTPSFFTDITCWRDTTVLVSGKQVPFITTGWDMDIWLCENQLYPMLKNLDLEVQRDQTVDIKEVSHTIADIKVYPNPVIDRFTLQLDEEMPVRISICDLSGKTLLETASTGKLTEINIGFLPKGIYILRANTGKGAVTTKLMK